MPPTGDLACNPGMCPAGASNQRHFGSQACTEYTELHQPGPSSYFFNETTRKTETTYVAHTIAVLGSAALDGTYTLQKGRRCKWARARGNEQTSKEFGAFHKVSVLDFEKPV